MDGQAADRLTDRVLAEVARARDDRVRAVSEAVVRHLHELVRELCPSVEEWQAAIAFLTSVGQFCVGDRQEFILLSDVLGVSMLVEELNAPSAEGVTESTVLGPFYVEDPPVAENGVSISGGALGVPLFIEGTIVDTGGRPCRGVTIDTWQSDGDGRYDVQYEDGVARLRARLVSDDDGRFAFWSIVPSSYPVPTDGPVGALLAAQGRHPFRPAHVHFRIAGPGFHTLTTHLFVQGDPYLCSDVVFGVRESLIDPFAVETQVRPGPHADRAAFAHVRRTFVLARS